MSASNQSAQYRLLETSDKNNKNMHTILEKIDNISTEYKHKNSMNNVTNYNIEQIWRNGFWVRTKLPAFYKDGDEYKPLYYTKGEEPHFWFNRSGEDYIQLFVNINGEYINPNPGGQFDVKKYKGEGDNKEQIIFEEEENNPENTERLYSAYTQPTGQVYIIKAHMNDMDYVGMLMDSATKEIIRDDVIPNHVLGQGKLYKADTLELVPMSVEDGMIKLGNNIIVPIYSIVLQIETMYLYDPNTNEIEEYTGEGGIEEGNYISDQITLTKDNIVYNMSVAPNINGKYYAIISPQQS